MKELFYIKGDPTNPEGVKEALLEKYPNAKNPNNWAFTDNDGYYCVFDNKIDVASIDSGLGSFLKEYGTKIFPKKKQEFEEKIMYRAVCNCINNNKKHIGTLIYDTIESAMASDDDAIGYEEIKVKMLKK